MKALLCAAFFSLYTPHAAAAADFEAPKTVAILAGPFIEGSDSAEREYAYTLDEKAYGHSVTRDRGWYENEVPRQTASTNAFSIMTTPVTNKLYAEFIKDTGHVAPQVDVATWKSYGLIHPYSRSLKFQWAENEIPHGRANHPVTMVTIDDVTAFSEWLSVKTDESWRLPTESEWEKAMRGSDGNYFPWGNTFDATLLNSHDAGPFDTMPVGSFAAGASPSGVLDAAGQVFEWVAEQPSKGRHVVKGGSWDDSGCGTCRPAAHHSRPDTIRHILIGFRLVHD